MMPSRISSLVFSAQVVKGSHRGRSIGTPTINLQYNDVPQELLNGVYACFAQLEDEGESIPAVMHYGPRPVFKDSPSCEVHLIDRTIAHSPMRLTVAVIQFLRDIADFPSREALLQQMEADIHVAREILGVSSPGA